MTLDFAGPVPDPLNPGVSPETLDGEFVHQPHAAENLNRVIGHAGQALAREEFRLRALPVRFQPLIDSPGRRQRQIV